MDPALYKMKLWQGATWERQMTLKDDADQVIDLSAYSARMQIRATYASSEPILSLHSESGGGIELASAAPNITVTITAEQTAALDFAAAVYDLEIESPEGKVDRLIFGPVTLQLEATR